jgi:hypothetical protein
MKVFGFYAFPNTRTWAEAILFAQVKLVQRCDKSEWLGIPFIEAAQQMVSLCQKKIFGGLRKPHRH